MIKAEWTNNDALSAEQTTQTNAPNTLNALDCIGRQAAIGSIMEEPSKARYPVFYAEKNAEKIRRLPSAQPERLTDDDFETIRIHLNAYKEKLCNQQRWKEAEEYQRIIDRFMAFASAQQEPRWIPVEDEPPEDEQIVWVTIKHGYTPAVVKRCFWDTEDKRWCDGDFGFPLVDQPIAWMPIVFPKPYERSEDEQQP